MIRASLALLLFFAFAPAQEAVRGVRVAEALAERRTALVIGNGAYAAAPLRNPVNDARAMAAALERCGFKVAELENATRDQMVKALRQFGLDLQGGGVGLFYFAGHGMQVKGRNYLMPVGGDFSGEDEVAYGALDADAVLAKLEAAGNRLNLMILDACRNNPFATGSRSASAGLAQMDAPAGSYIAFATAPGRTAADGAGSNGLYTRHLLAHLEAPGLKVEDIFKRVRNGVMADTQNVQVPWESSSLRSDFYFVPSTGAVAPALAPPPVAPRSYLAGAAAERALTLGTFETPAEASARLAELPPLRVGTARLQKANYDLATQRLPVELQIEPWATPQVVWKKGILELDRAKARAFCEEGAELPVVARFEVVSGKLVPVLSVQAAAGSAPLKGPLKGRLLFYRPRHMILGTAGNWEVTIGEQKLWVLHPGEFYTVLLPPGPVQAKVFYLQDHKVYPHADLDLVVDPDHIVYVVTDMGVAEVIPPGKAEPVAKELKNLGEKELE